MTRTNAGLTWVVAIIASAIVAVPMAGADGYESVNSLTGAGQDNGQYSSLNSVTGSADSASSSQSATSSPTSANAILADSPQTSGSPSSSAGGEVRTVNSVVGDEQPPTSVVQIRESSGFDWSDAGIGALAAFGLALMTFGAARLIARQRRSTVESHA